MRHAYTIVSILMLCCFFGYSIGKIYGFTILPDEFGYWSYAAAAAGYDWSGIVSMNPYYSYGYGAVLLPVFVLFQDSLTAYRAAVVVNFVMLAGIGFMLRYLALRLFPDRKGQRPSVLMAVILFYPPLLLYTRTTMAETMLAFLYVLITVLAYRYLEQRKRSRLLLLLVMLVYIHFVHMRTIALFAAGLLTVLIDRLFFAERSRNCRQSRSELRYLPAVATAAALFVLGMCVRGAILDGVYGEASEIYQVNDYRGQLGKFSYLMTLEGFGNLIVSIAGKILYLGLATFGTALWGLRYAWKVVVSGKDRKKRAFWCFIILSSVGALAVSAVYMIYPGRADALAYGRYHEYVFPVLMLAGLYEMQHTFRLWKGVLFNAVLELCMLIPVLWSLHRYHQTSLHACMIFGISYLYDAGNTDFGKFYLAAYGFGVLLMLIVAVLVSVGRREEKRLPILFLIAVLEVLLAMKASAAVIDTGSIGGYRDSVVADRITELMGDISDEEGQSGRRVLYIDGDSDSTIGTIQFLLRDTRIAVLDKRDAIEDYGEDEMGTWDLVLVDYRDDYGRELCKRYEYTLSSGHFVLYYNRK